MPSICTAKFHLEKFISIIPKSFHLPKFYVEHLLLFEQGAGGRAGQHVRGRPPDVARLDPVAGRLGDVDLDLHGGLLGLHLDTRSGDDITREVASAFDRMLNALRFYALSDDATSGED